MSHRVPADDPAPGLRFLRGGGEMGALIRQLNWEPSGLGHPAHWPASLKTAVGIMLNSAAPVYIAWGARFVQLYNDAYRLILGELKHPAALGGTTPDTWHEIWDFVGPMFDNVVSSGRAVSMQNTLLTMLRNGYPEECYFNFSYSPLTDELGDIKGVIVTGLEITEKFIDARRAACIKQLVQGLSNAADMQQVGTLLAAIARDFPDDLPLAAWYAVRAGGGGLDLVAAAGIARGSPLTPEFLDPATDCVYAGRLRLDAPVTVEVPLGAGMVQLDSPAVPPSALSVQPLCYDGYLRPDGYLIVAFNPKRPSDDAQRMFLKEVATQIEHAARRLNRQDLERRENQHQYQAIMDVVPCLVWMSDESNVCNYFNHAWLRFRGRTLAQEINGGWADGIHPDDLGYVIRHFDMAVQARRAVTLEYRLRHANGNYRWVLDRSSPRHNSVGAFQGYIGTCLDVTERKQAIDELRVSERRFRNVLQNVGLASLMLDRNAGITFFNEYLLRLTGWELHEVIGRNWFEMFTVPGAYNLTDGFAAFLDSRPETWYGESEVVTRSGERRLIRWSNSVLRSAAGEVTGTASIGADITEQKRAEQEIRRLNASLEQRVSERTADLEQARNDANMANQAKSSFLAAMSHEIRTPMNGVLGTIDVLQRTSLGEDQGAMVDLIRESAFSLLTILDDILDFSKIEAGRLDLERSAMSVAGVVGKACAIMDHLAASKGVGLSVFIDPALPQAVLGDELRLRQVLLNLVNNGIKFSSGGAQPGRVAVRATALACSAGQVGVEIEISDNGIGMNDAAKARLFTAFTQADASTTRRFGGTGLGLVISRHLVDLMGGSLTFDSAPGVGSTFTVRLRLPVLPDEEGGMADAAGAGEDANAVRVSLARAAAFAPPLRQDALRAGRLILVAEDNDTNQKVILMQLALLGYAADVAPDGRVALDLWQGGSYAMLLCDLHMPEMDGYQLARAIRAGEGARRRPIVALTANALQGEADQCRAAGMDDYLVKPLQLAHLQAALDTWLPAATPALDVGILEAFVGDDAGVILSLLKHFRTSAGQLGAELKAACVERRPVHAAAQAHKLKSAARTVGARGLGELCARIEATAGADAQLALLPDFERELDAVDAFLQAYIARST